MTRFRGDCRADAGSLIAAAKQYMSLMPQGEIWWLSRKPYDHRPGNEQFYSQLYTVMNLLRAMDLPGGARVLEVGSGPGWVSELLMLLGFEVDCVEPSQAFVAMAHERINRARYHYRIDESPAVRFHTSTLENAAALPNEAFDGVIFHDALHHMIDEEMALGKCYRCLRNGGVLGISEDAWRPGDRQQESALEEEMARYHTLESPFTQEYLDHLLTQIGFVDIERYCAINGFFSADLCDHSLELLAQSHATHSNNLTARRRDWSCPTTNDPTAKTLARVEIRQTVLDSVNRRVRLRLELSNEGESAWLCRQHHAGWITIALCSGQLGAPDFIEAQPRHRLPRTVLPGESLVLELIFFLPEDYQGREWKLDLINEGFFWFSQRGTPSVIVGIP